MPRSNFAKFKYLLLAVAVVSLLALASSLYFFLNDSGSFSFASSDMEIVTEGQTKIIRVPAGGNLQEAIKRAQSGDIIELQAGATYSTEIILLKKKLTDFITIRTSAFKQLPENQRVSPQQAKLMAKIVTKLGGTSAVATENGANRYRFIGIEFTSATPKYIYNLVYLGTESKNIADTPSDFEFDRCYFHSNSDGVIRRGIGLNSANTTIKNSYFEGFAFPSEETQAICGWSGTKNIKILNNYIEGGAENIMFGGSEPVSPDHIPTNIEIRGNIVNKLPEWRGKFSSKTLLELKDAKQVQIIGNLFTNNITGSVFRLTVRNETGGAPYSMVEDVVIRNNIFKGSGEGINILGLDNNFPSQKMKRVKIQNNLFLEIDGKKWDGSGYFVQISDGEDIEISNNTVFQTGTMMIVYGATPKNLIFRDNILGYGTYGTHLEVKDFKSPPLAYFASVMKNNVVVNNLGLPDGELFIPSGNFKLANHQQVGFSNLQNKDYALSATSKFKGKALNKKDIGANFDELRGVITKEMFEHIAK